MRSTTRITPRPFALTAGALLGLMVMAATPGVASAQSDDAAAQAQAAKLFDEAGKAMDRHSYDEACPKFEKVVGLQPEKVGARLALADCYEQQGKIGSAAVAWKEAAVRAATASDARVTNAVMKAKDLAAKAPRLMIRVPDAVRSMPELAIQRNGQPIDAAQWGKPMLADAGVYEIVATAKGKKPWSGRVTVVAGTPAQIDVGALQDLAAAPPAPSAAATPGATTAPSASVPPPLAPTNDTPQKTGGAPKWAWAVGGLGVVSAGVAVAFVVQQGSAQKTFNTDCKGDGPHSNCTSEQSALSRDFGLWLGFGAVGVVALAVSTYAIVTAPPRTSKPADSALKAAFWVMPGSGGAGLRGQF